MINVTENTLKLGAWIFQEITYYLYSYVNGKKGNYQVIDNISCACSEIWNQVLEFLKCESAGIQFQGSDQIPTNGY